MRYRREWSAVHKCAAVPSGNVRRNVVTVSAVNSQVWTARECLSGTHASCPLVYKHTYIHVYIGEG
jgi:hypothetical protein